MSATSYSSMDLYMDQKDEGNTQSTLTYYVSIKLNLALSPAVKTVNTDLKEKPDLIDLRKSSLVVQKLHKKEFSSPQGMSHRKSSIAAKTRKNNLSKHHSPK